MDCFLFLLLDDGQTGQRKRKAPSPEVDGDDRKKLVPYKEKEPSPSEISAKLDRLINSFKSEEISNSDYQSYGSRRAITDVPYNSEEGLVVGMPVIPDTMPASEFLARALPLDSYQQEIQYPLPEMETPTMEPYPMPENEKLQLPEVDSVRDLVVPFSTPFAAESIQHADESVSEFPGEIELQYADRYESDDYWKRFITTRTASHES